MKLVNLSARIKKADPSIETAALFNILLIALMFTLLSSRFIVAPGVNLSFAQDDEGKLSGVVVDGHIDVLSARGENMIIFGGNIYTLKTFAEMMERRPRDKGRGTLLIKADKNVDAQSILEICQIAKSGGFESVHLAANPYSDK